jgi:hypothetical protein
MYLPQACKGLGIEKRVESRQVGELVAAGTVVVHPFPIEPVDDMICHPFNGRHGHGPVADVMGSSGRDECVDRGFQVEAVVKVVSHDS